jgi:hypothetical protein
MFNVPFSRTKQKNHIYCLYSWLYIPMEQIFIIWKFIYFIFSFRIIFSLSAGTAAIMFIYINISYCYVMVSLFSFLSHRLALCACSSRAFCLLLNFTATARSLRWFGWVPTERWCESLWFLCAFRNHCVAIIMILLCVFMELLILLPSLPAPVVTRLSFGCVWWFDCVC